MSTSALLHGGSTGPRSTYNTGIIVAVIVGFSTTTAHLEKMATHRGVPFIDTDRPRDLLPLPFVSEDGPPHEALSQSVRQRAHRRVRRQRQVNDIIMCLNDLHQAPAASSSPPTTAQKEAQDQLFHQLSCAPTPTTLYTPAEAFEALLLSQPSYTNEELSCKVKPYQKSQVSLPKAGASAPAVEDVLDEAGREVVNGSRESMMLSPQEWGEVVRTQVKIRPYMDSTLKNDPEQYMDFVETIFRAGMLDFGCEFEDLVTPFFVEKKSGMLRLV